MQSIPVAALPGYCYPVPCHFLHFRDLHLKKNPNSFTLLRHQIHTKNISSLILSTANNFRKEQEENLKRHKESYPDQNHTFADSFYSSTDINKLNKRDPETRKQEQEEETLCKEKNCKVLFTNMWWTELKAALGQRINVEGIISSTMIFIKERHLALPHVTVPDIRYVDWDELRRRGFQGVVFDKDNTITAPYSLTLWGPLSSSIEQCKSVFGHDIAVFSNSSGLYEYDHDGSKARILEGKIGIKVIRHRVKKPAGTAEEIEKHFGCRSSQLIMVGDRPFTDIVYGNRNGFLTILTEPLSLAEEPFIVGQVRKLELFLVNCWFRRGLKPISHSLLPDAKQCVKDSLPLMLHSLLKMSKRNF